MRVYTFYLHCSTKDLLCTHPPLYPLYPLFLSQQKLTNPVYIMVIGYPLAVRALKLPRKTKRLTGIGKKTTRSIKVCIWRTGSKQNMVKPQNGRDRKGFCPSDLVGTEGEIGCRVAHLGIVMRETHREREKEGESERLIGRKLEEGVCSDRFGRSFDGKGASEGHVVTSTTSPNLELTTLTIAFSGPPILFVLLTINCKPSPM